MKIYNADSNIFRAAAAGAARRAAVTYFKFHTVIYGHWHCSYVTVANVEWCILIKYITENYRKPGKCVGLLVVCIWIFLYILCQALLKLLLIVLSTALFHNMWAQIWRPYMQWWFPNKGTCTPRGNSNYYCWQEKESYWNTFFLKIAILECVKSGWHAKGDKSK